MVDQPVAVSERDAGLSRRSFLVRTGGLGATALFGGALAACGDSGGAKGGSSGTVKLIQPTDLTLVLYSVDYLAEDLGFYKEEGLTPKRVPLLGGPVALQGLLSGAGAANMSTPGEMLGAIKKGQGVKGLMSITDLTAATLVISKSVAAKLGVTGEEDVAAKTAALKKLKGARFGITTPGSQTDGFTRMALKQAGLDAGKDAKIVPLQNAANNLAALQKNRIDGFIALSPVTETAIVKSGAVGLLSVTKGELQNADKLQGQTLMARTDDIERNPELYEKLARAYARALRVVIEEPDRAKDTMRKKRFADIEEQMWPLMWANNVDSWKSPYLSPAALGAWIDNGLIADQPSSAGFPLDDAVDSTFIDKAVKDIGWNAPTRKAS